MKKKFLPILLICPFLLGSCDSLMNMVDQTINDAISKDRPDHFTNTDGKEVYIKTSISELTLLPATKANEQILVDLCAKDETPDFSRKWSGVKYTSEDTTIATVDSNGLVSAKAEGETRIVVGVFSAAKYVPVKVVKKELLSLEIKHAKTKYLQGITFTPTFELYAVYPGGFKEKVTPKAIDSSSVNTNRLGKYRVNVSYEFGGKELSTSYLIEIVDSIVFEPIKLDYTINDYDNNPSGTVNRGRYCPRSGNVKILNIPVIFNESDNYLEEKGITRSELKTKINEAFLGNSKPNGWESVKTFYEKESKNQLHITGKTSDYYVPGYSVHTIGNGTITQSELAVKAIKWYFEQNPSEQMSDYDSDNNGCMDGVNILYVCPDKPTDNEYETFWGKISFDGALPAKDGNPGMLFHMWASAFEVLEDNANTTADSHTYIHETGHTFGLNDYYNYGSDDNGNYRPAGGFVTMEHNTGSQDPYSCMMLGWADPIVPDCSATIELDDFQSSHNMIVLSSHPNSFNSPFDEYFIIELYTPTGLNTFDASYKWRGYYASGPQEPGIRVYHIDSRLTKIVNDKYTTELFTDPTVTNAKMAFTNTYSGTSHLDPLASVNDKYKDYNEIFMIRNATDETKYGNQHLVVDDTTLFHAGDSFNISTFKNQFPVNGKMDDNSSCKWSFSVDDIYQEGTGYKATISVIFTE